VKEKMKNKEKEKTRRSNRGRRRSKTRRKRRRRRRVGETHAKVITQQKEHSKVQECMMWGGRRPGVC
jgi:hypothetical protein